MQAIGTTLKESIEKCTKCFELLSESLNNFTENQDKETLIEMFSEMNPLELADCAEYYSKMHMYNCCDAIQTVIDNNIIELIQ